ncbi:G protein coupled glucose receptor regulating Gpa2 protein [Rhizoctonia solani]|uniref:G protein coupled glucose receptor regulating Gpa2 protein n=1 Tax=Rhizoctonia solani TaxID=456999 RepID=A0A8H8SU64_9AGAM|nr:G protein coupled glucose receptor regulating Gpa2 protein [Rhizoctonia solani]QRW17909.1 G protein coupled glucose receptor regulating Gpa2 protein [Rhizoctonia solani]
MSGVVDGAQIREKLCHSKLELRHQIGLSAIVTTGLASSLAVVILLGYVVRNHVQLRRLELAGPTKRSSHFFRTHVDFYMLSLLVADLLQGLGAVVNIEWIRGAECYCGSLCKAQGVIQTLGETGVAMSTLAISVHTFVVIFFSWHPPTGAAGARIWGSVIALIWTYLSLCVSVGFAVNQKKLRSAPVDVALEEFYAPTPFYCWIGQGYLIERIIFEYFWICALFDSVPAHAGIHFCRSKRWTHVRFHWRRTSSSEMSYVTGPNGVRLQAMATPSGRLVIKQETKDALKMLYYPAAYTALVLPLSIARWSTFDPTKPPDLERTAAETPFTATAIVVTIFGLSGVVNVIMFITTRPNVLGFGARRQARADRLREQGPTGLSTFGSIGPTARGFGSGSGSRSAGSHGELPPHGVLVMQEITRSASDAPTSESSPRRTAADQHHTRSGHTLRFEVREDSDYDLSDVDSETKKAGHEEVDVEHRSQSGINPPAPAHHARQ